MKKTLLKWCHSFIILFLIIYSPLQAQDSTLIPKIKSSSGKEKVELLNKFAATFVYRNPEERLRISGEALAEAKKIQYPKGTADALNNRGMSCYYLRKYDSAMKNYALALTIFQSIRDSNAIGGIYNNIANIYQKRRVIDSAIIYNKKALKIRRKINAEIGVSTSVTNLGLLNLMEGRYEEALKNFREALRIRRKTGRKLSIASSLNNIGALYWKWGNLNSALEYFEESLKLSSQEKYTHGVIMARLNIGLININLGELDFARPYIENAIRYADSTGSEQGAANGYYYLAILNNQRGNWNKSLGLIRKSMKYFEKVQDYNALSRLYTLEAQNYLEKNDLLKSGSSIHLSLVNAKKANDETLVASAYNVMGQLELKMDNYAGALRDTRQSLAINIKKLRLENTIADHKQLSDIYAGMKDYRLASHYLQKYAANKDSLFNLRIAANISNWRVKYETANKENKILRLNKENSSHLDEISRQKTLTKFLTIITALVLLLFTVLFYFYYINKKKNSLIGNKNKQLDDLNRILEEQNSRLINSNKTKDKLFSIIAHDLKGPFNGLLGLTSVLGDEIERMKKDEITETVKAIHHSSDKLYKLTKNLLDWSRIQIDSIKPAPELINIRSLFSDLKESFDSSLEEKRIKMITEAEENASVFCDPQIIKTILRNLISNSIKFTPAQGVIKLSVERKNGDIKIAVSDTGVGIEPEIIEQIFKKDEFYSSYGTEGEHGTGLGLKICEEMIEKCGSKIEVKSKTGHGAEFSFVLPAQNG